MGILLKKNFKLLASLNEEWLKQIREFIDPYMKIEPMKTISGQLTFEIKRNGRRLYLHSKYDPVKEARRFAGNIKDGDTVLLYGLGLGYHVKEVLNRVGSKGKVSVIETNPGVFKEALKHVDLETFFKDVRFNLILECRLPFAAKKLASLINRIYYEDGQILIHRPSLDLMPEAISSIREILLEWQAKQDSTMRFAGVLQENIKCNLELIKQFPCVSQLINKHVNKSLLLVAAGPSLDSNLKYIKKYKDEFIIFAVGSALSPLEKAGIKPNIAIITDPQEKVCQQIEGLKLKTPLILLPSVNPKIFKEYKGPKMIAYQKGIDLVEELAAERKEPIINTGGSVVTTALDIGIKMGCNPICFIGLDLAYSGNRTHAGGTMYKDIKTSESAELIEVKNYQGEGILAPPNLISYRKWIERRIDNVNEEIQFYNLSPHGAVIQGVPYREWEEVIKG